MSQVILIIVVAVTALTFVVALTQLLRPRRPTPPTAAPSSAVVGFTQSAFAAACARTDQELLERIARGQTAVILGHLTPPARASPEA